MTDHRAHWDQTHTAKGEAEVSWFQERATQSVGMIMSAAPGTTSAIIDVGGGASRLVDALLREGYSDLTVLDLSEMALSRSKARLGNRADAIFWIVADITEWMPQRIWYVWHDRAVFHFLTDTASQDAYIRALRCGTVSGSAVIMAAFALTGPERCSGLPVRRYSPASLADRLGPDFILYDETKETHRTPFNTTQDFIYAAFKRC